MNDYQSENIQEQSPSTRVIPEEFLPPCAASLMRCWHLINGRELAAVELILPKYMSRLLTLAQQPGQHQREAAQLTAQAYTLKTLLAGHKNDLSLRLSHSTNATLYSQLAQDMNFEMLTLIQQAVTLDYQGQHHHALQIYQQAGHLIDQDQKNVITPLLRSRVYSGLAGSYARQQERAEQTSVLSYLDLAEQVMPSHPEHDPYFPYADCGRFTVPLWKGRALLAMGSPQKAWEVFAMGLHPDRSIPERVRTEFLNHLAETGLEMADRDLSRRSLEDAVKAALALGSIKRYHEAYGIYQRMRTYWRQESAIRSLATLFRL